MRKWFKRCAVARALIGFVLLVVSQYHPPGIWMGKPLPPGRVQPQLAIGFDTAVILAPAGSLWLWSGTDYGNVSSSPQPAISPVPRRFGLDSDWSQVASGANLAVALKGD